MAIFLSNKVQGADAVGAIGFDAVEEWTVKESSTVSTEPVQDGSNQSDNYYENPTTADFSGVVTPWNFAGKGTNLTPEEFIRTVQAAKASKEPFDAFLSDDLQPIPSVLITDFTYGRTSDEGRSIKITMTVQQVLKAQKATAVNLNDLNLAPEISQQGQDKVNNGDSQTKVSNTTLVDLGIAGGKVLKPIAEEFLAHEY